METFQHIQDMAKRESLTLKHAAVNVAFILNEAFAVYRMFPRDAQYLLWIMRMNRSLYISWVRRQITCNHNAFTLVSNHQVRFVAGGFNYLLNQ